MSERSEALKILGLAEGASDEEVRAAYKRLSVKWHPDKNAGSRESHDMMPRINAAKDRIDRGGRHDDYADDDYDEDEDYYSDEDEDYYSDDYEFEFGPFASGRMDFGEFLRMYAQYRAGGYYGGGDACACPECAARARRREEAEARRKETRAAARVEDAARREAEAADLKLQQEDPRSSLAWRKGGDSRDKLIREHYLKQQPALAAAPADCDGGLIVTLSVADASLREPKAPWPPVGVDWDVQYARADAGPGRKWTTAPGPRLESRMLLSLAPGTEYVLRVRTGEQGTLTWSGQPEWGPWGREVRAATAGEPPRDARPGGKQKKKKDRSAAFFGNLGGASGGGGGDDEEEDEAGDDEGEGGGGEGRATDGAGASGSGEAEEEAEEEEEEEQEQEQQQREAPSEAAESEGRPDSTQPSEGGASASAPSGRASSSASAGGASSLAADKKKKPSKHLVKLQRRQQAAAGKAAEEVALAAKKESGRALASQMEAVLEGHLEGNVEAGDGGGDASEAAGFASLSVLQKAAVLREQYERKGAYRPRPAYAPAASPPLPLFYSAYDPVLSSYLMKWLSQADRRRADALEATQRRLLLEMNARAAAADAARAAKQQARAAAPAPAPAAGRAAQAPPPAAAAGAGAGAAGLTPAQQAQRAAAAAAQVQSLMAAVEAASRKAQQQPQQQPQQQQQYQQQQPQQQHADAGWGTDNSAGWDAPDPPAAAAPAGYTSPAAYQSPAPAGGQGLTWQQQSMQHGAPAPPAAAPPHAPGGGQALTWQQQSMQHEAAAAAAAAAPAAPEAVASKAKYPHACKYFAQGRCNRGAECLFRHDAAAPPPRPRKAHFAAAAGHQGYHHHAAAAAHEL